MRIEMANFVASLVVSFVDVPDKARDKVPIS